MGWKQYLRISIVCGVVWAGCGDGDSNGPGGAADSGADIGIRRCDGKYTLADFCEGRACPTSVDELRGWLCQGESTIGAKRQFENDCDGQTLISRLGNSILIYSFDAQGRLVGVRSSDDVPGGICDELVYVYGNLCGSFPMFPELEAGDPLCETDHDASADAGI